MDTINYDVAMPTIRELCSKEYLQNSRIYTGKGYGVVQNVMVYKKSVRTSAKISGGKVLDLDTLNAPVVFNNTKERERLVVGPTKSVGNQ